MRKGYGSIAQSKYRTSSNNSRGSYFFEGVRAAGVNRVREIFEVLRKLPTPALSQIFTPVSFVDKTTTTLREPPFDVFLWGGN